MKTKSKISVGDRICAVNITNGLPEWFEIQEIKRGIYSCKSLVWNTNTIWKFKNACIIGHSDL